MPQRRILILAGGRSDEHEVSIISARSVLKALESSPIKADVRVISRQGLWLDKPHSQKALQDGQALHGGDATFSLAPQRDQIDAIFPLIHGPFGEDGTLQGLLEMADLPYIGSGVLGSALCMDKAMSKDVLKSQGISQVAYTTVYRHHFRQDPNAMLQHIQKNLPGPWFVKPANLGSSVGISKAKDPSQLQKGLKLAFEYDRRVIVESSVEGVRELEVAILGNDAPKASPVGEITYQAEFYDYTAKYTQGRAQMHIPADIPEAIAKTCRDMALQTYRHLDCAGFARVDLFYQPATGKLFVNEVNTIPGFTPMSMYPKLWEAAGLSYVELIETLTQLAVERHQERLTAHAAS